MLRSDTELEKGKARAQSHGEKVEQQHMNEAVYSSATSLDKINKRANHSTKKMVSSPAHLASRYPGITWAANAERNP